MSTGVPGEAPEDVPKEVVEQAKAAFSRRAQGEVAVLVWDSLVDDQAPASDHRLRFQRPDVQIDLRILTGQDSSTIEGKVQPPGPAGVELQSDHGDVLRRGDVTDGTFTLERITPGVVRVCLQVSPPPTSVCTDWFHV